MNVDLVLEGGGVLGLTFIGAYRAIVEEGYCVHRVAGTSVGAFVASLIAAGYTPDELEYLALSTDFTKFARKTKSSRFLTVGQLFSLVKNKGIFDNSGLEEWLHEKLLERQCANFSDSEGLKIIASDITQKRMMIFPDCLADYGLDPATFPISLAVKMSTAIPYYFVPIPLKHGTEVSYIVDGGILSNYPIWIFDRKGKPRWPTFGMKIKDQMSNTSKGNMSLVDYTKDIIRTMIDKDETVYLRPGDRVRTIMIDYDESIDALNFDLSRYDIKRLIRSGYQSTKQFLRKFDFEVYCTLYRYS